MRACADCLRRSRLLGDLSPALDRPAARLPLFVTHDLEEQAASVLGPGRRRPRALDRSDDDLLTDARADEDDLGVEALCLHAPEYPRRLRDLGDPPAVLHVLGGVERLRAVLGPDLGRASVAIVGARRAPADARRVARRLGEAASGSGIAVVSGMAFGVDAAAHEGALAPGPAGAGVGGTIAVLAGGPERATPARMRHLHERIAEYGVVVSELPPGVAPRRWSFPARNRIIAALGDALVVVACAHGSGSLRSVQHAFALGRPIGAVPGPVLEPAYAGSNALLRGGSLWDDELDAVRAIVEPDDVRPLLRGDLLQPRATEVAKTGDDPKPQREVPLPDGPIESIDLLSGLDGEARALAERLLGGPRTIEGLIDEVGVSAVLTGLGALEQEGRLRRGLGGDLELMTARPRP